MNSAVGLTGLIDKVFIGGTLAYKNGQQVTDTNGVPILPVVSGASWTFEYTLQVSTPPPADTYVWRFWYLECQNSLSTSDLMVFREAAWVTGAIADGVKITQAAVAAGYSDTTTHSSGIALGTSTAYLRSNIIVAPSVEFLLSGYASSMTAITFATNTNLGTANTGLGLGPAFTSSNYAYFPQAKQTYGYYCQMVVSVNGAICFVKLPFIYSA